MTPREATQRIGGSWRNGRGMGPCPVPGHGKARGDINWSLSICAGAKAEMLVHCFAGCAPIDVITALRALGASSSVQTTNTHTAASAGGASIREHAVDLWKCGMSIAGTPAETYLASRGVASNSSVLRFIPDAWHAPARRRFPAMLAAVEDLGGGLVSTQRTFLTPSGRKAAVAPVRMMQGSLKSAAVRLAPPMQTLGLAEGVETALAASQMFGVPCWAACGARLHRVALPDLVRRVVLFADNDPPGLETADRAMRRFRAEGRSVEVRAPETWGADWNDVLLARYKA